MGKKKVSSGRQRKGTSRKGGEKRQKARNSDSESNAGDGDMIFEGADYLELEEDKELLSKIKGGKFRNGARNAADLDELYAVESSETSEGEAYDKVGKKSSAKKKGTASDGFASDLDYGESEDGVDEVEKVKAWGSRKKHFYGGNPNEVNAGKGPINPDNDLDEAEGEEHEANLLQLKQLQQLEESDFLDGWNPDLPQTSAAKAEPSNEKDEEIQLDLSKMDKKEKARLFHRENPEFSGIVADFETRTKELSERLLPVLGAMLKGPLPHGGIAAQYIKTKCEIILNYLANIGCYLMFKTQRMNLKFHPIIGRLVSYKSLLDQMASTLDKVVDPQIDRVVNLIDAKGEASKGMYQALEEYIEKEMKKAMRSSKKRRNFRAVKLGQESRPKKKLKIMQQDDTGISKADADVEDNLTFDEKRALDLYGAISSKKENHADSEGSSEDEEPTVSNPSTLDNANEDERRGITYEMAKNKGLAPKRSKLQRNPRVKHRRKFEKAKIRRKGQVREIRKESKKYIGEASGINMRVKKGVKLM